MDQNQNELIAAQIIKADDNTVRRVLSDVQAWHSRLVRGIFCMPPQIVLNLEDGLFDNLYESNYSFATRKFALVRALTPSEAANPELRLFVLEAIFSHRYFSGIHQKEFYAPAQIVHIVASNEDTSILLINATHIPQPGSTYLMEYK